MIVLVQSRETLMKNLCTDPELRERHEPVEIELGINIRSGHLASASPTAQGFSHKSGERRFGGGTGR